HLQRPQDQTGHHHSPVLRIRGNRPAAICARLRHYCAAQTAFRVWRRAASLSRSFHCARRHDRGAQGIGQAYQKSAARRRAHLAAGQREYRPHQAPHCIRPRILDAACEVDLCETGSRRVKKARRRFTVVVAVGVDWPSSRVVWMTTRAKWAGSLSLMSLFRRQASSKANGKLTRLFFASDFHGSQRIFRKFVNAAKHYEADVLVMGGDVVGKLATPVIREGNGRFRAHLMGKTERLEGQDDLKGFEERLGTLGFYSKIMDADEYDEIRSDTAAAVSLVSQH